MAALDRGNCVHGGGQGRRRKRSFPTSVLVVLVRSSLRAHVSRQERVLRMVGSGGSEWKSLEATRASGRRRQRGVQGERERERECV